MNCQQATKYIWDYCDNSPDPAVIAELESHCAECPVCRRHLELTRLENLVLKDPEVKLPSLSPDFTDKVLKKLKNPPASFETGLSKNRRRLLRPHWLGTSTALLGALLVVMLVIPGLFNKQIIPQTDPAPPASHEQSSTGSGPLKTSKAAMDASQTVKSVNSQASAGSAQQEPGYAGSGSPDGSSTRVGTAADTSNPVSRSHQTLESSSLQAPEVVQDFPYPVDYPGDYQLTGSSRTDSNTVDYHFTKTGSNVIVDMTVALEQEVPLPAQTDIRTMDVQNSLKSSAAAEGNTVNRSDSVLTWSFQENGLSYRATLNGNLTPQELASLAAGIKMQTKREE